MYKTSLIEFYFNNGLKKIKNKNINSKPGLIFLRVLYEHLSSVKYHYKVTHTYTGNM